MKVNVVRQREPVARPDRVHDLATWNIIPGPADWRVALYQELYNALASGNG